MKKIFLDTNVMLLFCVGSIGVELIQKHKRTDKYSVRDFERLLNIIGHHEVFRVTPNILTEISNIGRQTKSYIKSAFIEQFSSVIEIMEEEYLQSRELVQHGCYHRLGLSDVSVLSACDDQTLLVTDDLDLYLAASYEQIDVINFTHYCEFN